MRPLLIGESNPHSPDPRLALYPWPPRAAGARLMRMLGMDRHEYLRAFERVNLFNPLPEKWTAAEARRSAGIILGAYSTATTLVLLGARVARAFGLAGKRAFVRHRLRGRSYVLVPHPSGRCRAWNNPETVALLRRALAFREVD